MFFFPMQISIHHMLMIVDNYYFHQMNPMQKKEASGTYQFWYMFFFVKN
jgi:hypothetical protein